jgi:hypothetical protein
MHAPSDEQNAIIRAESHSRIVVLAAAGTGKTEVVAGRVHWVVEREGLLPGNDLLILSFSRSAVAEVKRRLAEMDSRLAAARVATFDSFATRLLALHAPDDDWSSADYEGRIRLATKLMRDTQDAQEDLRRYRHLIVDEVQDLVGDRAEFVKAILEGIDKEAGFTVLGDPAQGIYDFQLNSSKSTLTAGKLLRWVIDLDPPPNVLPLTQNYRARSKTAEQAAKYGEAIRDRATRFDEAVDCSRASIENSLFRLPRYDLKTTGAILERRRLEGLSSAVLCRFNSQALVVSGALYEAGVGHTIRPPTDERPVPAWVALAVGTYPHSRMSRSQFATALATVPEPHPDAEMAWRWLKRLEGRSSPDLALQTLASRIRTGSTGEELEDVLAVEIVVSSVHRAKGLEWDVVFLCGLEEVVDDPWVEARLLYVAMTRTRDEMYTVAAPDTVGLRGRDQVAGRWVRTERAQQRATQIELLANDVHDLDPAGTFILRTDPVAVQAYLATGVKAGDIVDLVLIRSSVDGEARAIYRIDHQGRQLGVTSEAFGRAVWDNVARYGRLEHGYPRAILRGRVSCVETVAGSTAAASRSGLGFAGLWLAPRLHGLADISWEAYE